MRRLSKQHTVLASLIGTVVITLMFSSPILYSNLYLANTEREETIQNFSIRVPGDWKNTTSYGHIARFERVIPTALKNKVGQSHVDNPSHWRSVEGAYGFDASVIIKQHNSNDRSAEDALGVKEVKSVINGNQAVSYEIDEIETAFEIDGRAVKELKLHNTRIITYISGKGATYKLDMKTKGVDKEKKKVLFKIRDSFVIK